MTYLLFIVSFLSPLLTSSYAAPLEERAAAPTVTIASGIIVGQASPVPNEPSNPGLSNTYRGIPFAQSPPLRFAPPEPPASWTTPIQATANKPVCIQEFFGPLGGKLQSTLEAVFNNPGGAPPEESEDCLYLNVYAPQNASLTNLKPVMFWIFGGNLQFGGGSLDFYNGASFAVNQDVVIVAANYRTNMLGFSNSPEIPVGFQNAGFLDQRLALQWVQENIAQFGGDPNKVTIFGESAGGYSVKQLLANPPYPLPFAAAIMESQQALDPFNSLDAYNSAVANFSCTSAPSHLECLRNVPVQDLKDYLDETLAFFGPVQEDGTSTQDIRPSINSGKFAKVPIMMGTNLNEGRVFEALLGLENSTSFLDFIGGWLGLDVKQGVGELLAQLTAQGVNSTYIAVDM